MNENENLVIEEVTENVEQTTEETHQEAKTYTQEEVDAIVGKRLARQEARIKKDYERKQRENDELVETLRAGTGKQTVGELNDTFTKFYQSKGIKINKKPEYSTEDIEALARHDADEVIRLGDEEVVDEVDRLTEIGAANMTAREKAAFKILAEHRQKAERNRELAEIGITEEEYNSPEFQSFAAKFNSDTHIKDIYDIYSKTLPKKEFKTMGSMKNNTTADNGVKEYYSFEEASKFTKEDFDKNPALYKAVVASMPKWK